jgi:hypothetical protein
MVFKPMAQAVHAEWGPKDVPMGDAQLGPLTSVSDAPKRRMDEVFERQSEPLQSLYGLA